MVGARVNFTTQLQVVKGLYSWNFPFDDANLRQQKYTSFRWNYPSHTEFGLSAWCLRFKSDEAYEEFKDMVGRCLWENNNGVSWQSAKVG